MSKAGVILTAETTNLTAAEQQGIGEKLSGNINNQLNGAFFILSRELLPFVELILGLNGTGKKGRT